MVTILPQYNPWGQAAQAVGSGLGEGLEEGTKRQMLKAGIGRVESGIQAQRDKGEVIDPLDLIMSMAKEISTQPGGLQALGELAPALQKSVSASNLLVGAKGPGGAPEPQPKGPGGTPQPQPKGLGGARGRLDAPGHKIGGQRPPSGGEEESFTERETISQQGGDISVHDTFNERFQENVRRLGNREEALNQTTSQLSWETAEQQRRAVEAQTALKFLNQKVESNFPAGISAPFQNELDTQYYDQIKRGIDPNRAWQNLYPKFRKAQLAEESLSSAVGSNRPVFYGDTIDKRASAARGALKDITDVDPEYARDLAQSELGWGEGEASKIVRPGDQNFMRFSNSVSEAPALYSADYVQGRGERKEGEDILKNEKPLKEWISGVDKKLQKFFKKEWNPNKDSLLALRADLYDKGYPVESFIESVDKSFPLKNRDEKLSEFNQNEYSKLSEPVIPGMQDIFSNFLKDFWGTGKRALEQRIRGKK